MVRSLFKYIRRSYMSVDGVQDVRVGLEGKRFVAVKVYAPREFWQNELVLGRAKLADKFEKWSKIVQRFGRGLVTYHERTK